MCQYAIASYSCGDFTNASIYIPAFLFTQLQYSFCYPNTNTKSMAFLTKVLFAVIAAVLAVKTINAEEILLKTDEQNYYNCPNPNDA